MSLPGMVVCKSKIIFRENLSGMVVYKMFRSKGKVDLAFFDTDLIYLSDNWKRILHKPEFFTA